MSLFYVFTTFNAFAQWLNHLARQHFSHAKEVNDLLFKRIIWKYKLQLSLIFSLKSWKWRHTAKIQRRRAVAMCGSQSCYTAVTVCPVCTQRRRFGWNPLFLCSCELAEQETNEEWTESEQSDSSWLLTLLKHSSDTATESEQMGFFFYFKSREWFYLSFK